MSHPPESTPSVSLTSEALLGVIPHWVGGSGPLYRKLALALRDAIQRGELPPGAKLPPERDLAKTLIASRSTVVAAYNLLADEEVVVRLQGSGTWVCEQDTRAPRTNLNELVNPRWTPLRVRSLVYSSSAEYDFCIPHLAPCLEHIRSAYAEAEVDVSEAIATVQYEPQGLPSMRRAVASYLCAAGVSTTDDQILITNGSQQGISLTAAAFLSPGDRVLVESPTYLGAIDAFQLAGAQLISVPSEQLRGDTQVLEEIIRRAAPRLLFVMPTCHTITGAVMSDEVRRGIAHLADLYDMTVVEDNIMSDFVYTTNSTPPIAAYSTKGTLLSLGSLSKVFWVGVRIGWMRMPNLHSSNLVRLKAGSDLGSSLMVQAIATHLLRHLPDARASWLTELSDSLDAAEQALSDMLPSWEWRRPEAGWSLWIKLPVGDATEFSALALRYGVRISPGPMMCADNGCNDHVRLVFAQPIPALRLGIEQLSRAWTAYSQALSRRTLRVVT